MPRAITDLSDSELQSLAGGLPPLEQFSDHQVAALAVHQGLMQEDEAVEAVKEKARVERAPAADAAAEVVSMVPGSMMPKVVGKALLTKGGRIGDITAETLPPIAGQIVGTLVAPGPGTVVGGATFGAAGDALAQAREYFRGERDDFSKGRNVAATIAGGVPVGGPIVKKPAEIVLRRALQGAGISVGSQAVGQLIDNGRLDLKQLAVTGMLGAVLGGGAGGVESALTRRAVLRAIRNTPEFAEFSGTDKELVAEVRKRLTPEAPTAPGEKNVTPPPSEVAPETAAPSSVRPEPVDLVPTSEAPPLAQMSDDELFSLANKTENQPIIPKSEQPPAAAAESVLPPAETASAVDQYRARPESRGGRYISADVARPLVPGFDPTNPSATNHQASEIAEQAFQAGLKDSGVDQVTLLAGGAGSGKSSANQYAGASSEMVYDGVFGSESSVRRLDQAAASGKPVRVLYVYRPMADAIAGMIGRRGGHMGVVPAEVVAGGHYRSAENFISAAKRYEGNPNVQFQVIDNSGPKGSARLVEDPVGFLEQVTKNRPSYAQALEEARNHPAVADLSSVERSTYLGGESASIGAGQRQEPQPSGARVSGSPEVAPAASGRDYIYNVQRADVMKDGTRRKIRPFVQIDPTDDPRGTPLTKAEREALPQPPDHLPTGTYTLQQVKDAIAAGPPAAVKVAAGESVVSPAAATESAVSSLATPKQIKVQRQFLLEAVRAAAAKAKSSPQFVQDLAEMTKRAKRHAGAISREAQHLFDAKHGDFITFHVPNDGTYRVRNNKEALEAFAEKVEKRFGKGLKSPEPTKRTIPRMTDAERAEHQVRGEDSAPNIGRGAAASIGRVGELPPPPAENTAPVDDPTYSQLPLQLPEMVKFYRMIADGRVPKIVEKIRAMRGEALGIFRWRAGERGSDSIELRADLFRLLSDQQKSQLLNDAVAWATAMQHVHPEMRFNDAVRRRFTELVKAAEAKALKEDPRRALDVFAHEIGHYVDFIPDADLHRGNILGRIASLKNYLKGFVGEHPSISAQPPTRNERAKLRRQAERELEASVQEITETIRREVPVYAALPITAAHITSILKQAQRDEFPELYDWFAGLDRADKVAVLRAAMKGIVDERAAALSAREQVGTKVVEEEVTRRSGEVTPEAIRARYDELLRAELRRRGLISERDIRRELEEAIAWWQGVDKIPAYFTTAPELYAETFSILLNNPAALAKRAPTFYRAFFNYLDRKPEVKAAYEKIQDDIRSGAISRQRVEGLRDAFREDEDSGQLQEIAGSRLDWRKVRDTLRLLFDRQHGPIEARALRRLDSPQSQRVLGALKDYLYRMTAVEGYARALNLQVEKPLAEANLSHNDLAEFMFHQRIANGDRQQLANPQGFSPKTSADRLEEMRRELGPTRYAALEAALAANREIYERGVVDLLERADVLTPELLKVIRDRTLYATFSKTREFNPLEHGTIEGLLQTRYGKDVTARIYRQIGYLGDVRSPYLAMTQKAFALINFAYKQMAVKAVRDFMLEHEPNLIAPAEERFTGGRWEPRIIDTAKIGTLLTVDKGEVSAHYVPREIAETMEHGSPLEMMIVGLAHRVLALPKALLTELNAGFWPVAFAKDLATLGLQLPGGLRAIANTPRAYQASRALSSGAENAIADAALRRLMVISRADPRGEHLGHPDEMTRILLRMGQSPQLWDAEAAKISRVMRAWMWWKRQGQTLERTIKIAGMMHLDSEAFASMPEWQKKRIVNELAGSPDFLERGRAAPIIELAGGPIFYNAWLQGVRAFKRAAQNDPRNFWTKFLTFFGLPALALYAFEKGLIDLGMDKETAEDHRDMLRSVPERDKLRGFVVPLGWSDKSQGKAAYLMLPFPDQVRYMNAILRKSAQTAGGDSARNMGLESMVQFGGQDLPGQNPMIAEASKWWQYAALGQNPYDSFRGKPAINDDKFKAGEGASELAKQSAANLTGGIVYRYRPNLPGDSPTETEKFLRLPVVGNVLGRWVRVSNAGLTEETDRTLAPVIEHQAQMRLVADEMARKTIAGEPWTGTENTLSQNDPYLVQYLMGKMQTLMENATGPEMQAFNRAQNVEQKAALLQAWEQREQQKAQRLKAAGK